MHPSDRQELYGEPYQCIRVTGKSFKVMNPTGVYMCQEIYRREMGEGLSKPNAQNNRITDIQPLLYNDALIYRTQICVNLI